MHYHVLFESSDDVPLVVQKYFSVLVVIPELLAMSGIPGHLAKLCSDGLLKLACLTSISMSFFCSLLV
jgi:hypothetical protein